MLRCFALFMLALMAWSTSQGQVQRQFPATALRGELMVTSTTEAMLNGKAVRLAPGARVRSTSNMLQMSAELIGSTVKVNYTTDLYGQLLEVWVLRDEEAKVRPWPRTPQEAQTWTFDPATQTWTKP